MTNERACANRPRMTRDEMQVEAMIIESLLSAAMALNAGGNQSEVFQMMHMAHIRADKLNQALDSLHSPEVTA